MNEFLSAEDLKELTGYSRCTEQRRMLDEHGIPYRPIGNRTIVLHQHIAAWVEGRPLRRHAEPDLSLVS